MCVCDDDDGVWQWDPTACHYEKQANACTHMCACVHTDTQCTYIHTYIHTFVLVFYQSQTSQQEATRLVVPLAVGTPALYKHRHTHTHRHTHRLTYFKYFSMSDKRKCERN